MKGQSNSQIWLCAFSLIILSFGVPCQATTVAGQTVPTAVAVTTNDAAPLSTEGNTTTAPETTMQDSKTSPAEGATAGKMTSQQPTEELVATENTTLSSPTNFTVTETTSAPEQDTLVYLLTGLIMMILIFLVIIIAFEYRRRKNKKERRETALLKKENTEQDLDGEENPACADFGVQVDFPEEEDGAKNSVDGPYAL
ncbi:uncharacterized protein [Ptychodera flava]|uniref:uncharacterized protein isoform X1 n=1 Tax=Ptychodera flava TaxID=63121 RepID=UPI003969CCC1